MPGPAGNAVLRPKPLIRSATDGPPLNEFRYYQNNITLCSFDSSLGYGVLVSDRKSTRPLGVVWLLGEEIVWVWKHINLNATSLAKVHVKNLRGKEKLVMQVPYGSTKAFVAKS